MVKLSVPVSPEWVAANERAYQQRQAGRVVTMVRPGVYSAPSSKGDGSTYTATVINPGRLLGTCTCPHGEHGRKGHCWHLAAAIAAEIRRVSRPAPAPKVSTAEFVARLTRQ